jgi:hypothetical protein
MSNCWKMLAFWLTSTPDEAKGLSPRSLSVGWYGPKHRIRRLNGIKERNS